MKTRTPAALLAATLAAAAHAQESPRITAVTLYPDSASVERELKVPGGTRHVVMNCVPGSVDLSTLQVDGDPELRQGEVRIVALPPKQWAECAADAGDKRATELKDKLAALEAQQQSDDIALAYLRQWGTHSAADAPAPKTPADVPRPAAAADALRHAAGDLLLDQSRVKRDIESTKAALDLIEGHEALANGKKGWRTVRFDVWTPGAATLHVRSIVEDVRWAPSYRASVDTARGTLSLERQADIVQATGEDWKDVRVRLSTGHANDRPEGAKPSPWFLDLLADPRRVAPMSSAPAPVAEVQRVEITGAAIKPVDMLPKWSADVAQGAYATEFVLPQAISFAADGQIHQVAIEKQVLPATLRAQSAPRTEAAVYLLAEATRPAGVWLRGPLLALRDGTVVGQADWQPAQGEKLQVPLGRDDRMQVVLENPAGFTSGAGLFDSHVERSSKAVYAFTNRHDTPVSLEVLDPTPVSRNEKIVVRSSYDPQPATTEWDKQPGIAQWTLALAPGQTQRISVAHVVSYPRDVVVRNLP